MEIGLVLVAYKIEQDVLIDKIEKYTTYFDYCIVVDNTPNKDKKQLKLFQNCEYISLGENLGIARAQNIGSQRLIEKDVEYLMYLDQDSFLTKESFFIMKKKLKSLKGVKLGAFGPQPVNTSSSIPYKGRIVSGKPTEIEDVIELSEIISSGMIIPVSVFQFVGGYDEKLFIDGVDHEWCWRAKEKGYRILMHSKAILEHQLGEGDKFIFGVRFRTPQPERTFYQYRNYFLLSTRKYVPLYWKLSNAIKYILKIFVYCLFFENQKEYAHHIYQGIKDGIKMVVRDN